MHTQLAVHLLTLLLAVTTITARTALKSKADLSTLELVHVIFRHGDRTPTTSQVFNTDPDKDSDFFPFGANGQLTLQGKRNSYRLGKEISLRYGKYLGDQYYAGVLNSTCSEAPRTQMTLQTVHAALFPPKVNEYLSPMLYWQPIPFYTIPWQQDNKIMMYARCPLIYQIDEPLDPDAQELSDYICVQVGWDCATMDLSRIFDVYDTLIIKENMGEELPEWAYNVYPEPLRNVSLRLWNESNKYRLRDAAGPLIEYINDINDEKATGTISKPETKMFLFSGHDSNIAAMLGVLGVQITEVIRYNAVIYIELHVIDNVHGIKIFYQNGIGEPRKPMRIGNYGDFATLEQFKEFTRHLYEPAPSCSR